MMNFYKKFDLPSLVAPNIILLVNIEAENTHDLEIYLINSFGQCRAFLYKPVTKYQQTNWIYRFVDLSHSDRSAAALWLAIQILPILITSLKYLAPEYFKVFKHLMSNNLEG